MTRSSPSLLEKDPATSDSKPTHPPAHHVQRWFPWFGRLFDNPWDTAGDPSLTDVIQLIRAWGQKRGLSLNGTLTTAQKPTSADFAATFPLSRVNWTEFHATSERNEIRCVWAGHATCLVKMGDVTFLTDPVFSQRCSPFQFMGPKRVVHPAFEIGDREFRKLDFVLISHCHYDHLDYHSVVALHRKFGPELVWYVPLRLKRWFTSMGIKNVTEMDWWQQTLYKDTTITFLPAQHWSNRNGLFADRKRTLWGSWLVESMEPSQKVWFAGDTGYCPVFEEIGKRHGPFDLSLIPIGAYDPRSFMKYQHVNPEEAVKIHNEVQSKQSIAIHCCTFCLTLEDMDEPPERLQTEMSSRGLDVRDFLAVRHGETIHLKDRKRIALPRTLPVRTDRS